MNARQKAKHYKKQLEALYEDYITSAMITEEVLETVARNMLKMEEQQVTCMVEEHFDKPVAIDDYIAGRMWEGLTDDPDFRQAVIFEGHTDPETGKYILEAKLTVVMPEVEDEQQEI